MVTALGVDVDASGNGVDPLTHRNIIKAHWVNTGVVSGLAVSGRSDLYYGVSAGLAVCSMGDADGYVEAYWPGGKTENTVSAGDGTYARIDTVYLLANTGTPDNVVHCKVVQGTPAASPVAPALPTGGLKLRDVSVPAGASTTSAGAVGTDVGYAIPYGANLNRLAHAVNTTSVAQNWTANTWWPQAAATTGLLLTDRLVTVEFTWRATTKYAANPSGGDGSFYAKLVVDGVDVSDGLDECRVGNIWERQCVRFRTTLAGGKTHSVNVSIKPNTGLSHFMWQGLRTVDVFDGGVAQ
jgi:hypothetical protein